MVLKIIFLAITLILFSISTYSKVRKLSSQYLKKCITILSNFRNKTSRNKIKKNLKNILTSIHIGEFLEKRTLSLFWLLLFVSSITFQEFMHGYWNWITLLYMSLYGIYLLLSFPKHIISNRSGIELIFSTIWIFLVLSLLIISSVAVISNNAFSGSLHFRVIAIFLVFLIVPFISTAKLFMDSSKKGWLIGIAAITTFLIAECYIFFLFGLYNLTHEPEYYNNTVAGILTKKSFAELFYNVLYIGSQNIFSLKNINIATDYSLIPAAEYIIGMIFNVLVVGFFVSYSSAKIAEIRQDTKTHTQIRRYVTSKCPNCNHKIDVTLTEDTKL